MLMRGRILHPEYLADFIYVFSDISGYVGRKHC